MNEHDTQRLLSGRGRRMRWPQLLLIGTIAVGLSIAAFFFLIFALIAGAVVATAIGIRVWWLMRKLRAEAKKTEALEGEYTVVQHGRTAERLEH